ncbi:GNAT family N-acetyltransferase [Candidatus Woesearchaeota archaeon]|nr:GNAT family N-acetyltransferase [Candidatus Woesearchaeota archaeon]
MSQYLELIKNMLLDLRRKPNIIKKTLAFIVLYGKNRVSKEKLVKQLKFCFVKCLEDKILGDPTNNKESPYWIFEGLIFEFEKDNSVFTKKERVNRNIEIVDVDSNNFKDSLEYLTKGESRFYDMALGDEDLADLMSIPNSFGKVIFIDSQFVGDVLGHCPPQKEIIELELENKKYNSHMLYIDTFVVLPGFEGKGLGSILLKSFIQEAERRGYKILEGHFRKEASGSYRLIRKFGAQFLTAKHNWQDSGETYMYCRLKLK